MPEQPAEPLAADDLGRERQRLRRVEAASRTLDWDFDALGNFQGVDLNGTVTSRSHNLQNEVTGVGSATLTFDSNGNMTTDETGKQFVYNAWNRLVQV